MDISIRHGNLSDAPFIAGLLEEYLEHSVFPLRRYSQEEIEKSRREFCRDLGKRLKERSLISFIAEEGEGIPVGFCLVEDIKDPITGQREVYINNVSVDKRAMGKWVSNKLMKKVEDYATDIGVPVLSGDITATNRRSMLFTMRYFKYRPEKIDLVKFLE